MPARTLAMHYMYTLLETVGIRTLSLTSFFYSSVLPYLTIHPEGLDGRVNAPESTHHVLYPLDHPDSDAGWASGLKHCSKSKDSNRNGLAVLMYICLVFVYTRTHSNALHCCPAEIDSPKLHINKCINRVANLAILCYIWRLFNM